MMAACGYKVVGKRGVVVLSVRMKFMWMVLFFFFQAEDGIRDAQESRGLGDVYKRQDRDYCIFISKSTPYGNLVSDSAASYYVDIPGMYGTSTDQKIIDLVEKAMYSRDQEELLQTRSAIQEYVAENLPMIALIWGDAIYPVRTDRWEGWTPMYGYGPVNYWSWFSLKPVES